MQCVQAIYQQPVTSAMDSGVDLGATLGVVAGGVAGYLGYQLKLQVGDGGRLRGEINPQRAQKHQTDRPLLCAWTRSWTSRPRPLESCCACLSCEQHWRPS